MTGERIMRGFRRLGVALAVPCFLLALGFAAVAMYDDFWPRSDDWSAYPTSPPTRSAEQPGPWQKYRLEPVDHDPFATPKKSVLREASSVIAGAAALGVALFLASWLIGWVFAGFARD